jgi:hypothetical protein
MTHLRPVPDPTLPSPASREPSPSAASRIKADEEWQRLARNRRGKAALATWAAISPNLGRHQTLDQVVDAMRRLDRLESNRYWTELLALARAGDHLAPRVMLQTVVPALEAEVSRWHRVFTDRHVGGTRAEVEQLVYAAAVQAIKQLERRDLVSWPVLDIVRATRRLVTSSIRADERWTQRTVSIEDSATPDIPAPTDQHPSDGLREALSELVEAGRLSPDNASLIWRTRSGLQTFDDLALELNTSADTLRRRRHRSEQALHGALADAA